MKRIVTIVGLGGLLGVLASGCSAEPDAGYAIRVDVPAGHVLWVDGQVPGLLYSMTCPVGGPRPDPAEIRAGTCPAAGSVAAVVEPDGVIPLRWSAQTMAARRAELICGSFQVDPAATAAQRILVESVDNWSIWCDLARGGNRPIRN
jgi:hypothetical protein